MAVIELASLFFVGLLLWLLHLRDDAQMRRIELLEETVRRILIES